jgi:hypothetical protein
MFATVLVGQALIAQDSKPWNVDRLCGQVEHVQKIPARNKPEISSEKRKPLTGVSLELYEWHEGTACCASSDRKDNTISQKRGYFEFSHESPGRYWLTMKWNGKDHRVPVVLEAPKNSVTLCSEQGIQLDDDGKASWWLTVTVD